MAGIPWNKGLTKETDKRIKKISETLSKRMIGVSAGIASTPEREQLRRQKISQKQKQNFDMGIIKGWRSRTGKAPSYPEKFFIKVLENNKILYKRELSVGKYFIDFAIKDKMIALEIDGHQHERKDRIKKDIEKENYLISQGWKVYRIKWKSINSEIGKAYIQNEIEKFLKYASIA